jgi:hypothetical protein
MVIWLLLKNLQLGVMVHACNPHLNQYTGEVGCICYPELHRRLRSRGSHFQASSGKKVSEILISMEKSWHCGTHLTIPVTAGSIKYEDCDPIRPGQKSETLSPKQPKQKKLEAELKW